MRLRRERERGGERSEGERDDDVRVQRVDRGGSGSLREGWQEGGGHVVLLAISIYPRSEGGKEGVVRRR